MFQLKLLRGRFISLSAASGWHSFSFPIPSLLGTKQSGISENDA
jgi:hypothetical protein